jgi:hypothetical protein
MEGGESQGKEPAGCRRYKAEGNDERNDDTVCAKNVRFELRFLRWHRQDCLCY